MENAQSSSLKKIAVMTSGGDAPGMNAAIRAVVLTARYYNIEVIGFHHGYNGVIENEWSPIKSEDVSSIIDIGGTFLKSARCEAFYTPEGVLKAANNLIAHQVDCLIVIGGDGSFRGALKLADCWPNQIIGVPGTIDNDIACTDATIGYYTAIETALEAIDKIRDTADAFERIFLVEVMGRHAGFIALSSAIGSGSERVLLPETFKESPVTKDEIIAHIKATRQNKGDSSYIIVVAENLWPGGATELAKTLESEMDIDCRPCILGYIQRGGHPVAQDRILATRLGSAAVTAAVEGKNCVMVGEVNHTSVAVALNKAIENEQKPLDQELLAIQEKLFSNS